MAQKRIPINQTVKEQLPEYVRDEFPLVSEFLKTYYQANEYQGAPADLIQNIDQYSKIDELTNLVDKVSLNSSFVSPGKATIASAVIDDSGIICLI